MQNKEKRNGTYKPNGNKQGEISANVGRDDSSDNALVVIIGCAKTNDEWVLDTACTFHMCPHTDWITTFDSTTAGGFVLGIIHHARLKALVLFKSRCSMA